MKKSTSIFLTFIAFLIIYILQANFFTWFTIAGVKPNLFIIFIAFLGLFAGKYMGIIWGVVVGLLLDIFMGKSVGTSAIMLGIIGIIGVVLDKNFSKDSRLTVILMMITSTIIYEIGTFIINSLMFSYEVVIWNFVRILLIETLYNAILTIILYPLIQRIGFKLEEIYKENKILTRYF